MRYNEFILSRAFHYNFGWLKEAMSIIERKLITIIAAVAIHVIASIKFIENTFFETKLCKHYLESFEIKCKLNDENAGLNFSTCSFGIQCKQFSKIEAQLVINLKNNAILLKFNRLFRFNVIFICLYFQLYSLLQ